MTKIASITKSVTQSIYLFLYMATIFGASPRVSIEMVSKPRQRHVASKYVTHWKKIRDQGSPDYQPTHSDAMQLYSIGAGQLVMVQRIGQSWDNEYKISAMWKKGKSGKQNKFVTETISYGRLKIRSEENKMYICISKTNGNIIFKPSADNNKKQQPRKRCLFMWSFTEEKHIQLSINQGGTKWFLTVKDDGIVRLVPRNFSSAKERSFIWLPTRSANRRPMKPIRKRYDTHARGFSLVRPDDCEYYEKHAHKQKTKLKELTDKNYILTQEIARLNEVKYLLTQEIKGLTGMPFLSPRTTESPPKTTESNDTR